MKVVMNGCFDCLHAGHKYMMEYATKITRRFGEVILLVNSDESVRQLKGPGRPVQPISDRVDALRGYWLVLENDYGGSSYMPSVTLRVFNSEEELAKILDEIKPDMILKGDDRPDTREIIGYGKYPICILPRLKGNDGEPISTTRRLSTEGTGPK